MDSDTTGRTSTKIDYGGIGGQQHHLIIVPVFPPGDPRSDASPAGSSGVYRVSFVLHRPGFPLTPEWNSTPAVTLKGDSHVRIAKPAPERSDRDIDSVRIQSFGDTGTLTFVGYPNDAGCLGKIEVVDIRADSFQDAETKAYRALSSYLNLASTALDVPLRVFQVESVELRTEGRRNSFLNPYQEVFLSIPIKEPITPEFAGYSFLYREALNTNSPIYQFLCFYKILEGIDKRRPPSGEGKIRGAVVFATARGYSRQAATLCRLAGVDLSRTSIVGRDGLRVNLSEGCSRQEG